MPNKLIFLGTGTSQGVPMIGCNCNVCKSKDIHDNRLRTSAYIEFNGIKILIDCGPDFRQQMLRENISDLDLILLTHQHKDHTGGLDDIRSFNYFKEEAFPIYAEKRVQDSLKMEYSYAFADIKYPGVPEFKLKTIDENPFNIYKTIDNKEVCITIIPIRVMHYKLPILGFRVGNLAYITDGNFIPLNEYSKLEGVETLIINTVRKEKHISHFSLDEALDEIKKIKAKNNYLTHLSHQIGLHTDLINTLPSNVRPAFDGQLIYF